MIDRGIIEFKKFAEPALEGLRFMKISRRSLVKRKRKSRSVTHVKKIARRAQYKLVVSWGKARVGREKTRGNRNLW